MQYLQKEDKEKKVRVRMLLRYSDQSRSDRSKENIFVDYLKSKNLFGEFLENQHPLNHKCSVSEKDLQKGNAETITLENGKSYLTFYDKFSGGNSVSVCEVLPSVYDDRLFHWSENKKYNTMETTLVLGVFEFHCIYFKENGSAKINVCYAKCDNRHKNKVTIAEIEGIYNADNDILLDAIDQ